MIKESMITRTCQFRPLRLNDPCPFKAHKGESIKSVIVGDVGYITWCLENTDLVLDNDAYKFYEVFAERP